MLTLNDGRNELWQWDTGRVLSVDADCSQVHFSNKIFGRSIDVDVVDSVAIIPDILLQTDKELTAWAFVGTAENGYTKISKVFKVNKRNKPADYVFTPPEQTTLAELVERLNAIEESQDPDAIKNAVEDYLEQNPVEAPVQSVNGQTGKVKLTATDVGAISQDDLQEATNEALERAKESGEFDGPRGPEGPQGPKGDPGEPGADGADYVLTDADKTEIAEIAAELVEIPEGSGGGIAVTGAKVGQTVKIAAVDENGVPTAWEPVDMPSGGEEWVSLAEVVTTENVNSILVSFDACKAVKGYFVYGAVESDLGKIGILPNVTAPNQYMVSEGRYTIYEFTTSSNNKVGVVTFNIDTRETVVWRSTCSAHSRSDGGYQTDITDVQIPINVEINTSPVVESIIMDHWMESKEPEDGVLSICVYGAGMVKGTKLFLWGLKK